MGSVVVRVMSDFEAVREALRGCMVEQRYVAALDRIEAEVERLTQAMNDNADAARDWEREVERLRAENGRLRVAQDEVFPWYENRVRFLEAEVERLRSENLSLRSVLEQRAVHIDVLPPVNVRPEDAPPSGGLPVVEEKETMP
jgi:hypothetical protein